jgi:uncharacterized membrane protein YfcA
VSITTALLAVGLGFGAGVLAGTFGVGGGILFVPTLLALGLSQLEAEATSLLAILPTVAAGVWRQQHYGNVNWSASLAVGLASVPGVIGGSYLAIWMDQDTLQTLFGVLLIGVAAQLVWRSRSILRA